MRGERSAEPAKAPGEACAEVFPSGCDRGRRIRRRFAGFLRWSSHNLGVGWSWWTFGFLRCRVPGAGSDFRWGGGCPPPQVLEISAPAELQTLGGVDALDAVNRCVGDQFH